MNAFSDDDGDIPSLPADTLSLLQQFHDEQEAHKKQFEHLQTQAESAFQNGQLPTNTTLSMDLFGEDWNASQFWYTDATAKLLARQLLAGTNHEDANEVAIAVVSAPSVYVALRNLVNEEWVGPRPSIRLLEFDDRFNVLGPEFIHYDFHQPLRLPAELKGKFDRIICDPPFLSEDCQTKTALTVRYLARSWSSSSDPSQGLRLVSCTGERMEAAILKLYGGAGVKTTTFEPAHSKGLSNEFRCYANFECEEWKWR